MFLINCGKTREQLAGLRKSLQNFRKRFAKTDNPDTADFRTEKLTT